MVSQGIDGWTASRDAGVHALDSGDCETAIKELGDAVLGDQSGESDAPLALAKFQVEDYEAAARHYRAALDRQDNTDWRQMHALAEANAKAEAHVHVPPAHYFADDDLLSPPQVAQGSIPEGPAFRVRPGLFTRLRCLLGNDRIHDLGVDVGSVIPEGFDAYVRLFHPAVRYQAGEEVSVRWSEIAAANGRTVHPEMQWPHISGVWEHSGENAPGLWDQEPEVGTLPRSYAAHLIELLAGFTSTPDRVWFCVWDGWGGLRFHPIGIAVLTSGRPRRKRRSPRPKPPAPTLQLPGRSYYLLYGPVGGVAESMGEPPLWQSANLWWPQDRAWCVATEIDFSWTYVGGSEACIQALVEAQELEAMPTRIDHTISYEADDINPPPVARA